MSELVLLITEKNTLSQCSMERVPNLEIVLLLNPYKPNGFFHYYYLEKSILHFRGVRLIFSSLA